MRPVSKGGVPVDDQGDTIVFKDYARSRRYLIDRIGEYCSYCERKIQANLAVEHVQPKDSNPDLALEWDNFLLGCTNCNSTKGDTPIVLEDYVWPDLDPTFGYFDYPDTGIVEVSNEVDDAGLASKIKNTIELVGLDKLPPNPASVAWERASDRRHEHRVKAILNSARYSELYSEEDAPTRAIMRELIKTVVIADGFWSIWMKAFDAFPEMTEMLKDCIPGTRM